jgi:ribonuclease H / adenosylcobalamin/alpha-ribazole phosphatase
MSEKTLVAIVQRHGSTVLNEDNKFRSRLDPPLDAKGIEQAEDAAHNLRDEGVKLERIVSSPLLRTCQTADAFAEEFGLEVEQDRALISWNLGFLSGKDKDEYGPILDLYIDNPKLVPPEGESLDDLEQRTFDYFDKELKKDKLTLYVSHNSNIVTLETLVKGDKAGRPESSETSVLPGGTMGVYVDSEGKYSTDVLFGKEREAEYGS